MYAEQSGSNKTTRKRDELEESEEEGNKIFKKSALLRRSPQTIKPQKPKDSTEESNMEEILKGIQLSLATLAENVGEIKKEVVEVKRGSEVIKEEVATLTENVNKIKKEVAEVKIGNEVIREEVGRFYKDIKDHIDKLNDDIKEMKDKEKEQQIEINNMKQRLDEIEKKANQKIIGNEEITSLKVQLDKIENNTEQQDKEKRKNNIIIIGLKPEKDNGNICKYVEDYINRKLELNINIKTAYMIKQQQDMIIAEVKSWTNKLEIMKNKSKLRNEKIYINNDLTIQERNIQKELAKISREHKRLGKEVKIGYQKITIERKLYEWDKNKNGIVAKN